MQSNQNADGKLDLIKDRAPKAPKEQLADQKLPKNKEFGRNSDGKQILPKD